MEKECCNVKITKTEDGFRIAKRRSILWVRRILLTTFPIMNIWTQETKAPGAQRE